MSKKEWLNPELLNLGLEATECEDGEIVADGEMELLGKYKCPYCRYSFHSQYGLDVHITKCHNKPVHPLPDGNEEDWIVPLS